MKLDLEANNVIEIEVSADHIRTYFNTGDEIPDLENALDNAQGDVFTGEKESVFIVIKVIK